MKPKHHIPLILLNIPLLLLSPAAHGQNQENDKLAAEVAKTEKSDEEKTKARLVKEAAEREQEAKKLAKETARLADEAAKKAAKEAAKLAKETAKAAKETEKRAEEATREAAKAAKEAAAKSERLHEKTSEATPPAHTKKEETPHEPRKDKNPRNNDSAPEKREPSKHEKPAVVEIPATEPERLAEIKVTEATRELQNNIDKRKTRIEDPKEAKAMVNEILGVESPISRAEIAREERFRPRLERQSTGEPRRDKTSPDQRRAASTYYQERLRGREVDGPPPEFFHHSYDRDNWGDSRGENRHTERVEYVRPRYLNNGRRYVHYDSRSSIPAILMAAFVMNQVRFQPTREIAPMFYDNRDDNSMYAMPRPPENYRNENSWVVSYPVDEKSMISSEDILFLQGTTQFSDPYSYDIIDIMADAIKAMPEEERFVIEGHASAEGSYESNMALSQMRAEYIVREIVRRGVSPYRLLPVGYGESEARRPPDAAETLRSQDRRVVVFRMKPETVAQR